MFLETDIATYSLFPFGTINIKEKYETRYYVCRKKEMVPLDVYANVVLKSAQNTNIPLKYVTSMWIKCFYKLIFVENVLVHAGYKEKQKVIRC